MGANHRIFPGDSLRQSVTSRAWNRVQDAADRVLQGDFNTQESRFRAYGWETVLVRVSKTQPRLPPFEWKHGHAIGFDVSTIGAPTMWPAEKQDYNPTASNSTRLSQAEVTDIDDLTSLGAPRKVYDAVDLGFGNEMWGVVCGVSENDQKTHWLLRVVIRGVVTMRVVAYATGDRVIGPSPPPPATGFMAVPALRAVWEPYALMAPVGRAEVLAIGAWYKLIPGVQWPRVYEVMVRI